MLDEKQPPIQLCAFTIPVFIGSELKSQVKKASAKNFQLVVNGAWSSTRGALFE